MSSSASSRVERFPLPAASLPAGPTVSPSRSNGSLAERVAGWLEERARSGPPGARLGIKEAVRQEAGVATGTFNEALRIAQSRGAIVLRRGPHGGVFASDGPPRVRLGETLLSVDGWEGSVEEAVRIRNALEPLLVEDALWHASPAVLAQMDEYVAEMESAAAVGDGLGFLRSNWALHAKIAEINPNPLLRSIYLSLLELVEQHTIAVHGTRPQLKDYLIERAVLHRDLVDALRDRDGRLAEKLVELHNTQGPTESSEA